MDQSTDGVTLLTGFVFDVLHEYRSMKRVCAPAFDMARGLDPNRTDEWVPIELYNRVCAWIEQNIGAASIRKAGVAVGVRAYDAIIKNVPGIERSPLAMMAALKYAASTMIRDPKGRGWEILDHGQGRVVMRRTQTFNCVLQDGLLQSLCERTGVEDVAVDHRACTRRGDEFCDYVVTWM